VSAIADLLDRLESAIVAVKALEAELRDIHWSLDDLLDPEPSLGEPGPEHEEPTTPFDAETDTA
jgi:hypothetical protein